MLPLLDMMKGLDSNGVVEQISQNFDLTKQQAEQAIAALMPAYSSGMKQNVSSPPGIADFLQSVMSGKHQQYADFPQNAFNPAGISDGNAILGQWFGNKAVSHAIASQASAQTGIDASIIEQLLPILAPIIMGGLYKQMTGQMIGQMPNPISGQFPMGMPSSPAVKPNPLPNPMAGTPFGDMVEQYLQSTGLKPKPEPTPQERWAATMENMMGDMLKAAQAFMPTTSNAVSEPEPEPEPEPSGMLDNPFGKLFEDMMAGKLTTFSGATSDELPGEDDRENQQNPQEPVAAEKEASAGESEQSLLDVGAKMFGPLLDTGIELQQDYQKSIDRIFNDFLRNSASEEK